MDRPLSDYPSMEAFRFAAVTSVVGAAAVSVSAAVVLTHTVVMREVVAGSCPVVGGKSVDAVAPVDTDNTLMPPLVHKLSDCFSPGPGIYSTGSV